MFIYRTQQGFTLLETIIAISIILVGLLSILALSTSSLLVSGVTSDEFLAANFAREGMEVVRSVRDSNWLAYDTDSTTAWNNQLFEVTGSGSDYTSIVALQDFSTTGQYLWFGPNKIGDTCAGVGGVIYDCTAIWYDPDQQLYFQTQAVDFDPSAYTQTNFSRLVTTSPLCRLDSDETVEVVESSGTCAIGYTQVGIDVIVQVQWPGRAASAALYSLEEYLYDWKY